MTERVDSAHRADVPMLSLKNISKRFFARERVINALESISLDVANGEFLTMVGPSGCGKSTILNIVSGLMPPSEGSVDARWQARDRASPATSAMSLSSTT